jgi:signal transduction histidine kinase
MDKELDHYLSLITNLSNPALYAVIFTILIFILLFITYRQIHVPIILNHEFEKEGLKLKAVNLESEKNKLEADTLRIVASLTESDPNPILRTDSAGIIIQANISAQKAFSVLSEDKRHLSQIINKLTFEIEKEISGNSKMRWDEIIDGKHYSIFFYGISSLGLAQIYFFDLTERFEYEKKLLESEQKYRSLSFYLHDQLEVEKQRIGMELHDSIGQNLMLVNLKLKDIAFNFDKYKENFSTVLSTVDIAIKDLREIMYNLRPRALNDLGLFAAVCSLSDNMSRNFGIKGSVDCSGTPERLEIKNELYLYRIIQESLSNILKHSQASEFHILFIYTCSKLKILISDNGVGFDAEKVFGSEGFGLLNMSERIKNLKGKMEIESGSQGGTLILFELPLVN